VGEIDFTVGGAELVQSLMRQVVGMDWADCEYTETYYSIKRYYFRTLRASTEAVNWWRSQGCHVTNAYAVGPIRLFWWEVLPVAFYVDTFGHSAPIPSPRVIDDLSMLLHRAGVSPAEWQVLEAVAGQERVWHQTAEHIIAARSQSQGSHLSPDRCSEAIANCLWKQWVQVLNWESAAAISAAVTQDCIPGPVVNFSVHQLQPTPQGARILQDLCSAIYGVDWSIVSPVAEVVYCKTRSYFTSEAQAAEVQEFWETEARTRVIHQSSRINAVGAWRPHWWLRFPHGFALDCEIERGIAVQGRSLSITRRT
jgi:hypothetical protein